MHRVSIGVSASTDLDTSIIDQHSISEAFSTCTYDPYFYLVGRQRVWALILQGSEIVRKIYLSQTTSQHFPSSARTSIVLFTVIDCCKYETNIKAHAGLLLIVNWAHSIHRITIHVLGSVYCSLNLNSQGNVHLVLVFKGINIHRITIYRARN